MRHTVLVFTLFVSACSNDSNNIMLPDLSGAKDMALGADMTASEELSCSGALDCYAACGSGSCIDACYDRDTAKAKMLDDALYYGCPVRLCAELDDGGIAACSSADVAAVNADPFATVSDECGACMDNIDPSSDCPAELAACEADQ